MQIRGDAGSKIADSSDCNDTNKHALGNLWLLMVAYALYVKGSVAKRRIGA